ncbi:hypothetical protein BJ742DRAFT_810522 [Cladochytrium replicatum]|nr:hypothetical protein BJ742DRAFT_810522 [Cladochytrium replicatum]
MQSDHPKKLWTRVGAINHTSRNPLARFEILWSDCVRVILTGDVPGYAYRFIDFHTSEILGIFMLREDSFPETWDLMLLSQSLETQQQPHATPPHHLPHIHTKRISTKNGLPSIPYEVFVAGALVIQQLRGIMQPPVSAAAEGELRLPTAGPWDPAISNKGRKLRGENAVSNVERAGPTRDTVVEMSTMDKALNMRPLVTLRNLNY